MFLAAYFVNEPFRRDLLRVLNRGESVNALKRASYIGRVTSYEAKQHEEMQAVADAIATSPLREALSEYAKKRLP